MIKIFKIGGNVVEDEALLEGFCRDFASVPSPKVLVHGGGVMASALQKALGQEPVKIDGRRVTDADALDAVTMCYGGLAAKKVCATLQKYGCNALSLSGCDGDAVRAVRRAPRKVSDGRTVDFGFVGDVKPMSVNAKLLKALIGMGIVPVLNAINHDGNGQLLNTNADTVASSVAAALEGELLCCFEMDGVLRDKNDPASVIPCIDPALYQELLADGSVSEGMIPKIENCFDALRCGASGASILNAGKICSCPGTRITL